MSNAIRALDERQDATASARCSSCVSTGHDCTLCGKSFLYGDLRVRVERLQEGERLHFFCAGELRDKARATAIDLLLPDQENDPSGFFDAGRAVVEEVGPVVLSSAEATGVRAAMSRLLVVGYLSELGSPALEATSHVGRPGVVSEVCDLCSTGRTVGALESCGFWHSVTGGPGEKPIHYQGPWAYCVECKPLVETKDHTGLARRAMKSSPPQETDPERRRRHFEGLYQIVVRGDRS